MKKSRTKTIIVAVSVIAFLVYLVLVIGINLKYPKAQLEEKQLGEAMTADDFEITATDVSFMSQEDFSDIYAFEKEIFKEAESGREGRCGGTGKLSGIEPGQGRIPQDPGNRSRICSGCSRHKGL